LKVRLVQPKNPYFENLPFRPSNLAWQSQARPFPCSEADTKKAVLTGEVKHPREAADKHCSFIFGKASRKNRNVCLAFRSGHFDSGWSA